MIALAVPLSPWLYSSFVRACNRHELTSASIALVAELTDYTILTEAVYLPTACIGNQVVVTVVFAHALPGWAVILARSPRCRRGKGGVLRRYSGVVRSACSLDSSYVDSCCSPIVLHVPGANSVPSRPPISSSSSTGWVDPRTRSDRTPCSSRYWSSSAALRSSCALVGVVRSV